MVGEDYRHGNSLSGPVPCSRTHRLNSLWRDRRMKLFQFHLFANLNLSWLWTPGNKYCMIKTRFKSTIMWIFQWSLYQLDSLWSTITIAEHQQSSSMLLWCLFLAHHASSAPVIALSDKWKMAIMQSMWNERSNSQEQREREKARERESDGGGDEEGCVQRSEVAQHLTPDWCDVVERGRTAVGFTSMITQPPPTPPPLNLTQPYFTPPTPLAQSSQPWRGSIIGDQWRQKL